MERDGDTRAAGPEAQDLSPRATKVAGPEDVIERAASRDRILGPTKQAPVTLGNARHLVTETGVAVGLVEQVAGRLV